MSEQRRTKAEREADLPEIARMYLQGHSQRDIAAKFKLQQPQVSKDIAEIYRRWGNEDPHKLPVLRARELARVDELERVYWRAWEHSLEDKEVQSQEKSTEPTDDGEKEKGKVSLRREGQAGNPAFLAGIQWCIERRCKLLGLDAAQKAELVTTEPIKFIMVHSSTPPPSDLKDKESIPSHSQDERKAADSETKPAPQQQAAPVGGLVITTGKQP